MGGATNIQDGVITEGVEIWFCRLSLCLFLEEKRQAKKQACVLIWGSALLFSPLFHLFRVSGGIWGRTCVRFLIKNYMTFYCFYLEWGCWYCRHVNQQVKTTNHPRYFIAPVWAKTRHMACFLLFEPMLTMNNLFLILQKYWLVNDFRPGIHYDFLLGSLV